MRKSYLLCTLVFISVVSVAQDFSNRGKDFWVAYGYHASMNPTNGGPQNMVLYFAAEQATTVKVEIPGVGYSQSYAVPANSVVTSAPIPKIGFQDVKLTETSSAGENKGIHISADKPIVAYAHIYNQSVSGATILFPTNTLGREYYSVNYTNNTNSPNANCWFYVIAADTGTTTVEVIPSATIVNNANVPKYAAGVPITITLTQGQVYNFMGQINGLSGVDLTGSTIRSVSTGSGGCKRIGVFSGSGRINITCNGNSTTASSDNYMSQAFPKSAWGKRFLTVPASGGNSSNIYRICVSDPTTVVKINGITTGLPLTNNFYYEVPATNFPQSIEADKPVTVAQYLPSQNECGNATANMLGDPEVIYLSPVEQNINKVLWNATPNFGISQHYFNVVISNKGTALTSFKLDGVAIPPGNFFVHPSDANYSYLQYPVTAGQHIIQSDSGFNAIAYGYGSAESYGYNAGTNIKDQYRFISVDNQYALIDRVAATCVGAQFNLSMTFPYQPTQLIWQFNGLFPDDTIDNPVGTPIVVNGNTLYRYTLTGNYTIAAVGTYPIRIIAQNPTADGCNGVQEMDYDLEVYPLPTADFTFTNTGCVSNPVLFNDNSPASPRPIIQRYWNFGDNTSTTNVTSASHTYAAPGSYTAKYSIITDIGCKSDTMQHAVVLSTPPVAAFAPVAPLCANKVITFDDQSSVAAGSITKWTWNFGDGSPELVTTTGGDQTHTFPGAGPYNVTLKVEASGCESTVTQHTITLNPNPVVAFNLPNVCLQAGNAQFNSNSTISDGTESQFTYSWNFGDGSPLATVQNPLHNYTATGPYNVSLTVTSNNGCPTQLTQALSTIYAEPKADFVQPAEVCLGTAINFTHQSTAPGSTITQWLWTFGDATNSTDPNPSKTYAAAGTYTVTLTVTSAVGCQSVSPANIATRTVTVNALPTASYNVSLPGCVGQNVTFTSTSVPNSGAIVKWTWNYGDATPTVNATNGNPLIHSYASTGTYPSSLQVETDKGCKSTIVPKDIAINAVPLAGFVVPEICINDAFAPFTDTSKVASGSVSAWEWNFGDPNATGGNPNISNLQNPTHHYTVPGNYTIQLIATTNAGCKDTITNPVTVNGSTITPQIALENTTALCSNKEITIKDGSSVNSGNILRVEIYWDITDPTNKTVDNDPAAGKTYTHAYPEFFTPATKNYTIRYEVWTGITCVNSVQLPITMLATPQLAFGSVLPVCDNVPAFLLSQAQVMNGLTGDVVFAGTGITSPATGEFDPDVSGPGSHTITYTYNATNGCSNSIQQTVIVNPTPEADAGPTRYLLEGGYINLTPKLITGIPVTYEWTPAQYLDNPFIASPRTTAPTDFLYKLTVTSDQGCVDEDTVSVKLLKSLVIPNIFSPNGDNVNDKWVIAHLESYPGCVIQIFNRYGQMVQRFENYQPWDGKIKGQDAPIGTYYYIIDPKHGRKPITGYVDIIR